MQIVIVSKKLNQNLAWKNKIIHNKLILFGWLYGKKKQSSIIHVCIGYTFKCSLKLFLSVRGS